jgi:DNA-binding NarL/FixJ family response regulator
MKKILIIDDDASALRILRKDITDMKSLIKAEVTEEARSLREALKLLTNDRLHFDLVITDLRFKKENIVDLDGLEIINHCKNKQKPPLKVLVVTYDSEISWYKQIIDTHKADGLLSKNYEVSDLAAAIQTITEKEQIYISPQMASWLQQQSKKQSQSYSMSDNAKNILRLKAEGMTDEVVAVATKQSLSNVKKIIRGLFDMYGCTHKMPALLAKLEELGIAYR